MNNIHPLLAIAAILVLFAVVGTMDYEDEMNKQPVPIAYYK